MNLARHAAVLWRFRFVAIAGVTIGILLAVLASYKVGFDGGPSLTPRGSETWSANSSILVTQPGFPEGRVTLPEQQVQDAVTTTGEDVREPQPDDQVEFADPARLAGLADLYTKFLVSDEVLQRVKPRPKAGEVLASPFLASSGGQVLPVIQLTTTALSKGGATKLNQSVYKSLQSVIEDQQRANAIGQGQRVEIKLIDAPEATLTSPRKRTASILVLAMCLLGTVALAHLLEALRPRRDGEIDGIVDWDFDMESAKDAEDPEDAEDANRDDGAGGNAGSYVFSGRKRQ
jgi:hypothetical protein